MKPVIHLFRLTVAADNREAFRQIGVRNLTISQKNESGTLAMYASPVKGQQETSYVFEAYASEEAYQIHRQSPQFQDFAAQGGPLLTERVAYEAEPLFLQEKLPSGQWLQADDFYLKFAQVETEPCRAVDFEGHVLHEMQQSMDKEPGVLAMYAMRDADRSSRFYFFEVYASEAAYLSHRQSPHFQHYITETAAIVKDKLLLDLHNGTAISKGALRYKI
ncbi:putative quinol monooxygenase [Streptococcus panodentis]|uniref:Antibiotic biosynthesis monooxygenase n=1 Tax=Streptococcus panodentis TaxID=1581472 RepID=A0ABS5AYU9_9STRE|nr:antibiotic biosynthesis monooxygenase [Streptococcus panodentis]MBP2621423.1 antibiotic biosynthesis monooxygenase [Streptococcus panodentis]